MINAILAFRVHEVSGVFVHSVVQILLLPLKILDRSATCIHSLLVLHELPLPPQNSAILAGRDIFSKKNYT